MARLLTTCHLANGCDFRVRPDSLHSRGPWISQVIFRGRADAGACKAAGNKPQRFLLSGVSAELRLPDQARKSACLPHPQENALSTRICTMPSSGPWLVRLPGCTKIPGSEPTHFVAKNRGVPLGHAHGLCFACVRDKQANFKPPRGQVNSRA